MGPGHHDNSALREARVRFVPGEASLACQNGASSPCGVRSLVRLHVWPPCPGAIVATTAGPRNMSTPVSAVMPVTFYSTVCFVSCCSSRQFSQLPGCQALTPSSFPLLALAALCPVVLLPRQRQYRPNIDAMRQVAAKAPLGGFARQMLRSAKPPIQGSI